MFKQVYLLSHTIFCKPEFLRIDGKEMQLKVIQLNTSPYLLRAGGWEGWRAANKIELEGFAREYKPGTFLEVHAVGSEVTSGYFGYVAKVFKTEPGGKVVEIYANPIWGLPPRTLILWVKERAHGDQ